MLNMSIDASLGRYRFYKTLETDNTKAFDCSVSFFKLSPKVIYMYNILGAWSQEYHEELREELKAQGFEYVIGWYPTEWKPHDAEHLIADLSVNKVKL